MEEQADVDDISAAGYRLQRAGQFLVPVANPQPVPLASLGTFEYPSSGVEGAAANKRTILFTDPSGTMAQPYYPLDAWVAAAYTS